VNSRWLRIGEAITGIEESQNLSKTVALSGDGSILYVPGEKVFQVYEIERDILKSITPPTTDE